MKLILSPSYSLIKFLITSQTRNINTTSTKNESYSFYIFVHNVQPWPKGATPIRECPKLWVKKKKKHMWVV
jgi:hypothetical protein